MQENQPLEQYQLNKIFCATDQAAQTSPERPLSELKAIIDRINSHVCGHARNKEIKLLLQRNKIWNRDVEVYLTQLLETCTTCKEYEQPKGLFSVSLSALYRQFNKVVC